MHDYSNTSISSLHPLPAHERKAIEEIYGIRTIEQLLNFFPHRYEDKTKIYKISSLKGITHPIQIKGKLTEKTLQKKRGKGILIATLRDETGVIKMTWFNKVDTIDRMLKKGVGYLAFGRAVEINGQPHMTHPKTSPFDSQENYNKGILPLYPLKSKQPTISNELIRKLQRKAIKGYIQYIPESIPLDIRERYDLIENKKALTYIHFPPSKALLAKSLYRLKFDELLAITLSKLLSKGTSRRESKAYTFTNTTLLKEYFNNHLKFQLTREQKAVIKEICLDMRKSHQMNRLIQGDVGTGKTIVAFMASLVPIAHKAQVAILTPTESLANQHYKNLTKEAEGLGITIAILTGSTPEKTRTRILASLAAGETDMLIGTHALLYERVEFKKLGLAIIDEQHRFGVEQRSKMWTKNSGENLPHILLMTATTIPRTLSMTLYGDLDVSTIREKPSNRKPIITSHHHDNSRLKIFSSIRREIEQKHQIYIVYPRIISSQGEEIYKDLMDGYESIQRAFPNVPISILHGKMPSSSKAYEMNRFVQGETKIMMGTTILEVGINVPKATMIVIENAEAFGLAQLHQLRGRVGRDHLQSYCLLVTRERLSAKAKQRIETMIKTQDGFDISQMDLESRGPGNIFGVEQSGFSKLKLASLEKDIPILKKAHKAAEEILLDDPLLAKSKNQKLIRKMSEDIEWMHVS